MKTYGEISLVTLVIICFLILLSVPGYSYYMAVYVQKSQKPFPAPTITMTACHYPQDIVVRFTMLIANSFIGLTFFIITRWINQTAKKIQYYERFAAWKFWMAELSVVFYSIAIGTLDGKSTGKYHTTAAVLFFIMWLYIVIEGTIFLTKMRIWDSSIMSCTSIFIKQLLAVYIVIVWIYCIVGVLTSSKSNDYVVIVEWNSANINIMWLLSFAFQWKHFKLVLVGPQTKSNNQLTR